MDSVDTMQVKEGLHEHDLGRSRMLGRQANAKF